MKNQLSELAVDYGAEIIQLDGEWVSTWNHELGSDHYLYLRSLNDELLVNNRVDVGRHHPDPETGMWDWKIYTGDFEERERMVDWVGRDSHVFGKSDNPWQAWVTIDQAQWSWNETPRLLSPNEVIADLLKTVGDNGNYPINLGPQPSGAFHPRQAAIVREVGNWLKRYEDGIYGTRGGPFTLEDKFTSTVKDGTICLFVLNETLRTVELKTGEFEIEAVTDYGGETLEFEKRNDSIIVDIPSPEGEGVRVVKLITE